MGVDKAVNAPLTQEHLGNGLIKSAIFSDEIKQILRGWWPFQDEDVRVWSFVKVQESNDSRYGGHFPQQANLHGHLVVFHLKEV